jgi:hypothetical protein
LRFDYDFSQGILDYPQPIQVASAEGDFREVTRKDRQIGHSAGFIVRIYRDIGLGLTWTSSKWTSPSLGFSRTRNVIGATLTYQF